VSSDRSEITEPFESLKIENINQEAVTASDTAIESAHNSETTNHATNFHDYEESLQIALYGSNGATGYAATNVKSNTVFENAHASDVNLPTKQIQFSGRLLSKMEGNRKD
jgi:hypothetical protein